MYSLQPHREQAGSVPSHKVSQFPCRLHLIECNRGIVQQMTWEMGKGLTSGRALKASSPKLVFRGGNVPRKANKPSVQISVSGSLLHLCRQFEVQEQGIWSLDGPVHTVSGSYGQRVKSLVWLEKWLDSLAAV